MSYPLFLYINAQLFYKEIKKFQTQSRKYNSKKFHHLTWNMIQALKDNVSLEIKDPALMNISLGANILSWLRSGTQKKSKETIVTKICFPQQKKVLES